MERFHGTYKNNQVAAQTYRPNYKGPATVFRCLERDAEPFNKSWEESGIPHQFIEIGGGHDTLMFPPNVQTLAEHLNKV